MLGVVSLPSPSLNSPCGSKSNLSDLSYDGLKQISVFKALKVMWEKKGWFACKDHICSPSVCALGPHHHHLKSCGDYQTRAVKCFVVHGDENDCGFCFLCPTPLSWCLYWQMIFHPFSVFCDLACQFLNITPTYFSRVWKMSIHFLWLNYFFSIRIKEGK